MSTPPKPHGSPSKVGSSGRTYDSNLVSREMHRLGHLAHLPSLVQAHTHRDIYGALASAAALPSNVPNAGTSVDSPWGSLHVHVLPLFNGEPLRIPIEDMNTLVKQHIKSVVSISPSKALSTLEKDGTDLISSGMMTLKAKLSGIDDDDKLVSRVVEVWGFFFDQVLPYIEGVLLPLHTDPVLSSLYRTPKTRRPSDLSGKNPSSPNLLSSAQEIDVRTIAIRAFRDHIILPIFSRLHACFMMSSTQDIQKSSYQQPRLQQMLLVLISQGRQRPIEMSLTSLCPPPSAGEAAIQHLLEAVRAQSKKMAHNHPPVAPKPLTFLSGGQPRDRRGRIQAQNPRRLNSLAIAAARGWRGGVGDFGSFDEEDLDFDHGGGERTPRVLRREDHSVEYFDIDRDQEREFLDSLRSPDPVNKRGSTGGWGLGDWRDDGDEKRKAEDSMEEELGYETDWAKTVDEDADKSS